MREAAIDAIQRYGTSCTGSRFLNGNLAMHNELEQELADFCGKEAGLVFSTGMSVNLGTISALVGRGEYRDHRPRRPRQHRRRLQALLRRDEALPPQRHGPPGPGAVCCSKASHALVVVDGVFSMGGDIAPLPEIVAVCQRYGARLMVDDAHSLGVLAEGRGTAAHFGLTDKVDLIMGTFSKAFASLGGVVVGDAKVIDYIKHNARSLIFSASMPPSNVAAVQAALADHQDGAGARHAGARDRRLYAQGLCLRWASRRATARRPSSRSSSATRSRPLPSGRRSLRRASMSTPWCRPPWPPTASLLRTSYMATHTDEQLDRVLETFGTVGKELGII